MGFWNGKVDGPLDKMFDFNRDGKLNAWERAMELGLLMDDEDDYQDDDEFDEDMDSDFDDDEFDDDEESEELMEEDWDSDYDESDEW
ncbi:MULTISPECIES: hypothetical protein [Eubacterium]|jgi:hypothetical protein|uniref:Uncharacterized protein n=1 Tax=Eubacterium album TaxID=2978477 RepID=A0ABT2M5G5_9FIRM|nr:MULTISPECIES: hypothetical protein [unclassified Eubacterium (in: firmicutes)]MCT7399637.1 hypothetical protein [Eubacterium sp. LFL-14]